MPRPPAAVLLWWHMGRWWICTPAPCPTLLPGPPHRAELQCPHGNCTNRPSLVLYSFPLPTVVTGVALHMNPCHKVCSGASQNKTAGSSFKEDHWVAPQEVAGMGCWESSYCRPEHHLPLPSVQAVRDSLRSVPPPHLSSPQSRPGSLLTVS